MSKSRIRFLIQNIVMLTALVWIVLYVQNHTQEWQRLLNIPYQRQGVLFCLYAVIHTLASYKLFLMLGSMSQQKISFYPWLRIFTVSRFMNVMIPQGANLYRSYALKRRYQFSYVRSIGLITVFTWFESSVVAVMLFCFSALFQFQGLPVAQWTLLSGILMMCLMFVPWMTRYMTSRGSSLLSKRPWLLERFMDFTDALGCFFKSRALLIKLSLWGIIWFALYVVWTGLCFAALGFAPSPWVLILFTAAMLLSRTVNIVPGNLGLQELLGGALVQLTGGDMSQGIFVSGLMRIVEYLCVALGAVIMSPDAVWHMSQIRKESLKNSRDHAEKQNSE